MPYVVLFSASHSSEKRHDLPKILEISEGIEESLA